MALPTKSEVQTLDFTDWSLPFISVDGKAAVDSSTLDFTDWSLPIAALSAGSGDAGESSINVWVNVLGTWKQADSVHVNVSGAWKDVTEIEANVSSTWKT